MGTGSCLLSGHRMSASGRCMLEACVIEALSASSKGGASCWPVLGFRRRIGWAVLGSRSPRLGRMGRGGDGGAGELTGS